MQHIYTNICNIFFYLDIEWLTCCQLFLGWLFAVFLKKHLWNTEGKDKILRISISEVSAFYLDSFSLGRVYHHKSYTLPSVNCFVVELWTMEKKSNKIVLETLEHCTTFRHFSPTWTSWFERILVNKQMAFII